VGVICLCVFGVQESVCVYMCVCLCLVCVVCVCVCVCENVVGLREGIQWVPAIACAEFCAIEHVHTTLPTQQFMFVCLLAEGCKVHFCRLV
jgi:hypothetical protein